MLLCSELDNENINSMLVSRFCVHTKDSNYLHFTEFSGTTEREKENKQKTVKLLQLAVLSVCFSVALKWRVSALL